MEDIILPRNTVSVHKCSKIVCLSFAVIMIGLSGLIRAAAEPVQSDSEDHLVLSLNPPIEFLKAAGHGSINLPFHQTVPLAEGDLYWTGAHDRLYINGEAVDGYLKPVNYWPDGSVRLLWVRGLWPFDHKPDKRVLLHATADESGTSGDKDALSEESGSVSFIQGSSIMIEHPDIPIFTLDIHARILPLTEEKSIPDTNDPEYWDSIGQYHWAQARQDVAVEAQHIELQPRVHEIIKEHKTPLYDIYRLRGDGGPGAPSSELEWQLRVHVFKNTPLLRFQMTWQIFMDPEVYGLDDARITLQMEDNAALVQIPDLGLSRNIAASEVLSMTTRPNAQMTIDHDGRMIHEAAGPSNAGEGWLLRTGNGWWGLALPDMTLKGPGEIQVHENEIQIATWNGNAGSVVDLRRSTTPGEFGLRDYDFDDHVTAEGISFTTEFSIVHSGNKDNIEAAVKSEKSRAYLWFAPRQKYVDTGALGPWKDGAFENNQHLVKSVQAQLHFILASQMRWRWTGLLNFGDIRTNFATTDRHERGFYTGRWVSYGRYGWRNGSGEPYAGMFQSGLFLEDRDVLMGAKRYALHVADVDVRQPRFRGTPLPRTGGMHRRNKDHWSGSIQMQYTPSRGLYLAWWLTGHNRISDALNTIRDYSLNEGERSSIFAASAWINHYAQTHDPKSKQVAEKLLAETIRIWEARGDDLPVEGAAALYFDNFRRELDCYPVLLQFFEATGDLQYLEAMHESIVAQDLLYRSMWASYAVPAYLLANGYSEDELGTGIAQRLRNYLEEQRPKAIPPASGWDYETLENIIGQNPASFPIGIRARNAPLIIGYFGRAVDHE